MFTKKDSKQARDLVEVLKEAKQEVNPKLQEMARWGGGGGRNNYSRYGYGGASRGFGGGNRYGSAGGGMKGGFGMKSATGGFSSFNTRKRFD